MFTRAAVGLALALLCACAKPEPKPDRAPVVQSKHRMVNPLVDSEDDGDGMKVEGTLGTLEQSAIQAGLNPALLEVTTCFNGEQKQKPYLGGKATLQFRVARDGTVKKLELKSSTLGSMVVNRCILDAARTARFARPRGGEAEFDYSVELSGQILPVVWDPGMVRDEIEKNREKLTTIRVGRRSTSLVVPAGLVITMHLNRRGRVVSVGMVAVEEIDEEFASHLVSALKAIKFERPNSSYAKVTFSW